MSIDDAIEQLRLGKLKEAERTCLVRLSAEPLNISALRLLARIDLERGMWPEALTKIHTAAKHHPENLELVIEYAALQNRCGFCVDAVNSLQVHLTSFPDHFEAWLLLGKLLEEQSNPGSALKAYFQAVTRAQGKGYWRGKSSTPTGMLQLVTHAIKTVKAGRRQLLLETLHLTQEKYGKSSTERVASAIDSYLRGRQDKPTHPQQRPTFLYIPGLPQSPYFDPKLHPSMEFIMDHYDKIRAEALLKCLSSEELESFLRSDDKNVVEHYLGGESATPAWNAYFFFRRGKRYEDHHRECPFTSKVLESVELCEVPRQAPEILFSVLEPETHILAHHGVTNARAVLHLPLLIPSGCALNLIGVGVHEWKEQVPVMFDDTYLHEAWNRSPKRRIILLMDCWNPFLTEAERAATVDLIGHLEQLHFGTT